VNFLCPFPRSVAVICNSRSSRRSPGRSITTVAVGFVTLGLLASYGANTAAADQGSGDRLGCGTFCQNGGGYGGAGPEPSQYAVTVVSSGTVTADADGYVPVTLTCHLTVQCRGAFILELFSPDYSQIYNGRSDLVVDAGATRTIGVPLDKPAAALAMLRSSGPTTASVDIDARQSANVQAASPEAINLRGKLTVAAPG
jgi:hypothetical protein